MFQDFIKRINQNPDSGTRFTLGRVVRLSTDDEVSKTRTVSVVTDDGTLFRDVLITYPSRFSVSFPDTPKDTETLGSLVILGFLDADFNKPFIVSYLKDSYLPVPQQPKNYVEWSNGDLIFSSDGYGNVIVELLNEEVQHFELRALSEDSILKLLINGELQASIGLITLDANEIYLEAALSTEKVETKTENFINLTHKVTDTKDEEIEKLKRKVKKQEEEIEELKSKIKKWVVESDSFKVTCKSISLGDGFSDAPVLFNKLNSWLGSLIDAICAISVTCTAPGSPSSPPINIAQLQSLKAQLNLAKSKYLKID